MKIRIIILGMVASLLLPLAGAFAGDAPAGAVDLPPGSDAQLPGQTADDKAPGRRYLSNGNGNGDKECKDQDPMSKCCMNPKQKKECGDVSP